MKIAIFTDNDFDKVNGVTTTLNAVLQHSPADLQPRIYTASDLPIDCPHYLAVPSWGTDIPFYRGMKMYWPRFGRFVRHARADGIGLVHYTTPGPVGLAALHTAWRLDLPMVGSFHTDLAAYTGLLSGSPQLGRLMGEYMRWPYGRCLRVLVPSEATRALLAQSRTAPGKLVVWPRGVDTILFDPARRRRALRDRWHASDRRPVVLYVGRLSREKGLAALPGVQAELHRHHVEHRLVIVGEGPMLDELKEACPDAVFTGTLSRESVADVFASADVFLFPSRTDTAGNVVLEAQASGLPVVVADAGGPREQIQAGETGLVTDGTVTGLATALAQILSDSARRARMGTAARTLASTRRWQQALAPLYQAWRDAEVQWAARPAATGRRPAVATAGSPR